MFGMKEMLKNFGKMKSQKFIKENLIKKHLPLILKKMVVFLLFIFVFGMKILKLVKIMNKFLII